MTYIIFQTIYTYLSNAYLAWEFNVCITCTLGFHNYGIKNKYSLFRVNSDFAFMG